MTTLRRYLLASAALGIMLLAPRAALAYQAGSLSNHSHNSVAGQGGVTLSPASISVTTLTVVSSASGVGFNLSTRQIFKTAGAGTYTTPPNTRQLRIMMVGGGGGGTPNNGGASSFGQIVASSGTSGSVPGGTTCTGAGAGGTGGLGGSGVFASSSVVRWDGIAGECSQDGTGGNIDCGGAGGGSVLFGGGGPGIGGGVITMGAGSNATANTGGGGGGRAQDGGGAGAGGGESVLLIINSPAATYPYVVGAGGAATGSPLSGAGAAGVIIVDEYY